MADKRDYYEVLGLQKGASDDEIKRAYRRLAKQYHPDINPGDKDAEEKFKELGEAYEVLGDAEKKQRYDAYGHAGVDPSYGGGAGFGGFGGAGFGGFEDFDLGSIFDNFFGGGGGGRTARRNAPTRGEHIRVQVVIAFEEAAFGCEKEIGITRTERCAECDGSGAERGTTVATCPKCGGAGQVRATRRTPLGMMSVSEVCSECGGVGKKIEKPCPHCHGAGTERKSRSLKVKIPAGIDEGQTISVRGEGNVGANGGPNGDMLVTIQVRPHALFVREGTSVICEMPVTYVQATLGAELEVPTIDGRVKYTMPEGTQTGTTFRIKGKGIPKLGAAGRGDQFVKVVVEVPKKLNEKQKELLRTFGESLGDKHYEKRKSFMEKLRDSFNK